MNIRNQNLGMLLGIAVVVLVIGVANRHVFIPPHEAAAKPIPPPRTFPRDYPIYPGASYQGRDEEKEQVNGQWYDRAWFHIRESSDKVIAWYNAHLKSAGYKPVTTRNGSDSKRYGFGMAKKILQMEIFIAHHGPTDFSVDFPSASTT